MGNKDNVFEMKNQFFVQLLEFPNTDRYVEESVNTTERNGLLNCIEDLMLLSRRLV